MATLRGRAKSKNSPAVFSWNAIANMSKNTTGQILDYDTFKYEYDTTPELADLVDTFDERSITLKTDNSLEAQPQGQTGQLDSMAKRAAGKVMNR